MTPYPHTRKFTFLTAHAKFSLFQIILIRHFHIILSPCYFILTTESNYSTGRYVDLLAEIVRISQKKDSKKVKLTQSAIICLSHTKQYAPYLSYLQVLTTAIILPRGCEEASWVINAAMAEEFLIVTVQNHSIFTRIVSSDTIIRKWLSGMEIEDKQNSSSFKSYYLVPFVFARYVSLGYH